MLWKVGMMICKRYERLKNNMQGGIIFARQKILIQI